MELECLLETQEQKLKETEQTGVKLLNININPSFDKYLSFFIVTPNMHKVHHHYVMPYTDSNYGNIFSFWDRLFGTFKTLNPSKIIYGVDTFFNEEENGSIKNLLYRPFEKSKAPTNK